jgi:peroxiredoxin/outer membrane lipoprotein-sorting protein
MLSMCCPFSAQPQGSAGDPGKLVAELARRCQDAKAYSFGGVLSLEVQGGRTKSWRVKFSLSVSQPGGYALKVYDPQESMSISRTAYWLVSDGVTRWAYTPGSKQYSQGPAADDQNHFESRSVVAQFSEPVERLGVYALAAESSRNPLENERDPVECLLRLIVPALARLSAITRGVDAEGYTEVQYGGKKQKWPTVGALAEAEASRITWLTEITVEPETLTVGRIVWSYRVAPGGPSPSTRIQVDFSQFSVGESLPASTFKFEPPTGVKRVAVLELPGQTGSALVGGPAPDFILQDQQGRKIQLSRLKGRAVLLAFWNQSCPDCTKLVTLLQDIHQSLSGKGLVVLGVTDIRTTAAKENIAQAGLTFPMLDDSRPQRNLPLKVVRPYLQWMRPSSQLPAASIGQYRAGWLYRVVTGPEVFLIDRDGQVVGFLKARIEEEDLRGMLKTVGF